MKKNIFYILTVLFFTQINLIFGASDNSKFIYLLSPKGTETFRTGETLEIEWMSQNISKVNIFYLDKYDTKRVIAEKMEAKQNNLKWNIPDKVFNYLKIIIEDYEDSSISFTTQFYIRIKSQAEVKNLNKVKETDNVSTVSTKKLMPLGDSITEGYIEPDPIIYDGYRKKLKSMLEKNGLIFDFVGSNSDGSFDDKQHEGHGGFSAQNYARLSGYELLVNVKSYIQSEQPDYVLLHIGTNDINDFANIYNHNNIDTTVTAVGKILDSIYSVNSNIQVILAKIVNRLDNPSTSFSEVLLTTQYNTKLDSLVNVRILSGDKLSIVNMEIALNSTTDLSDAIHPNISGYEKMAPVWLNGIRNVLPKLSAKIFLEGAYSGSNSMTQSLKTAGVITTTQPFNTASWNYEGTEDAGTIPAGVVDWVLVSLRTGIEKSTEVACRAGFVKTDGTIVDLDGTSPLAFVVDQGSYYVVVKHRNHLQIMSAAPVLIQP